jgi:hypothetical protein
MTHIMNPPTSKTTGGELGATSALVLLWSGPELYASREAQEYWRKLDLSEGEEIHKRCNNVWGNYGEVIKNRKWKILQTSKQILAGEDITQVVIVAAGFSPMGIELASLFPQSCVFEVDKSNMEAKSRLCASVRNLSCLSADITDREQCRNTLLAHGWNPTRPTLLIFEGISYYITAAQAADVWGLFSSSGSLCLFEYLVPQEQIAAHRRSIPDEIFETILNYCGIGTPITRWSRELLGQKRGVRVLQCHTLSDIERERTGQASTFSRSEDGWIEVALLAMDQDSQPSSGASLATKETK